MTETTRTYLSEVAVFFLALDSVPLCLLLRFYVTVDVKNQPEQGWHQVPWERRRREAPGPHSNTRTEGSEGVFPPQRHTSGWPALKIHIHNSIQHEQSVEIWKYACPPTHTHTITQEQVKKRKESMCLKDSREGSRWEAMERIEKWYNLKKKLK